MGDALRVARNLAAATGAEEALRRQDVRGGTGCNVQVSIKAAQATIDAFYVISDRQKCVLGYTRERALLRPTERIHALPTCPLGSLRDPTRARSTLAALQRAHDAARQA